MGSKWNGIGFSNPIGLLIGLLNPIGASSDSGRFSGMLGGIGSVSATRRGDRVAEPDPSIHRFWEIVRALTAAEVAARR